MEKSEALCLLKINAWLFSVIGIVFVLIYFILFLSTNLNKIVMYNPWFAFLLCVLLSVGGLILSVLSIILSIIGKKELLDEDGAIKEYRYGREIASTPRRRLNKQARHIFAFDKQAHPEPPHQVDTDPFHHHHVPGDMSKRQSTNIQSLEDVFSILNDYIAVNLEYNSNHSF